MKKKELMSLYICLLGCLSYLFSFVQSMLRTEGNQGRGICKCWGSKLGIAGIPTPRGGGNIIWISWHSVFVNYWLIILLFSASLSSSLSDDLLAKTTIEVVRNVGSKGTKSELIRTNIQMIGALRSLPLSPHTAYEWSCHCLKFVNNKVNFFWKSKILNPS